MRRFLEIENRFLDLHLELGPRLLLVLPALLIVPTLFAPLYPMTMFAPEYPDGLRLAIYSYKLDGGNVGQDVREITVLNHYIGMRDLRAEDFTEFAWMPFVLGAIALLFLRAAVHGHVANLVDVVVIFFYFSAFSLASFAYKLWSYGHRLDPTAPVTVEPFMPPLFGAKQLANFEVYSYPALGSYPLLAAGLVVVIAVIVAWRQGRAAA